MSFCHISCLFQNPPQNIPESLLNAGDAGFSWIAEYFSSYGGCFLDLTVKDLSRLVLSHLYWNYPQISYLYLQALLLKQNENGSFEDLRETARAVSCLSAVYSYFNDKENEKFEENEEYEISETNKNDVKEILNARNNAVHFLLTERENWSFDLYDTVYILAALADAGIFEEELSLNLCENDAPNRHHPGTTALILTALQKQKNLKKFSEKADFMIFEFISKKSEWLVSVRENGFWKYTATSNLVLQTFVLCNQKHIALESLPWLISSQYENGSWENDLNTTSLSLLTL